MLVTATIASLVLALAPLPQDAGKPGGDLVRPAAPPAETVEAGPNAKLLAMIGDTLEKADGTTVSATEALEGRKHVLIYFSASWCPPCRRFTPDLVKYATEHQDAKDFAVILVGSDRSAEAQRSYMEKSKMTFFAVPYDSPGVRKIKQAYSGSGIPNLVILDENGVALKGSYETDGRYSPENRNSYIGPQPVLKHFVDTRAEEAKASQPKA